MSATQASAEDNAEMSAARDALESADGFQQPNAFDFDSLATVAKTMVADVEGIAQDAKNLIVQEFKLSLRCIVLSFLFALGSVVLITLAWIGFVFGVCLALSYFGVVLWAQVLGVTLIHLFLVRWSWHCAKTFYRNIGVTRSVSAFNSLFNRAPTDSANDS